jgi:hypothetical protein
VAQFRAELIDSANPPMTLRPRRRFIHRPRRWRHHAGSDRHPQAVFQAAVLDRADGEITEERFKASREALVAWLQKWDGKLEAVALEGTTGWRWVARELQSRGIAVQLTDAGQASALRGQSKRAKTDRSKPAATINRRPANRRFKAFGGADRASEVSRLGRWTNRLGACAARRDPYR